MVHHNSVVHLEQEKMNILRHLCVVVELCNSGLV